MEKEWGRRRGRNGVPGMGGDWGYGERSGSVGVEGGARAGERGPRVGEGSAMAGTEGSARAGEEEGGARAGEEEGGARAGEGWGCQGWGRVGVPGLGKGMGARAWGSG